MPRGRRKKIVQDCLACCLQGGGALGAYQVGIIQSLHEAGYDPHWFVGTSIGAINSAIAAGNPPKDRVEKLHVFWEKIASPGLPIDELQMEDILSKQMLHYLASQYAMFFGQPGFFHPHFPPPQLGWHETPDQISYYDTSHLKATLESLVDFDRINSGETRLTVGAVNITTGRITYFDSLKQKLGPEHVMASGALPPGFPAVEIDGHYYWDGGLSSNSPIGYVLTDEHYHHALCFMVHLFDSYGMLPTNIDEVLKRKKDIEFSSRFLRFIELYRTIHSLKYALHKVSENLPPNVKKMDDISCYLKHGWNKKINLVRYLYQSDESDLYSKDYEFSKTSIQDRIKKGLSDGRRSVEFSPWQHPVPDETGIALHDMAHILDE